jgi:polysaccharide export outer membrane protein
MTAPRFLRLAILTALFALTACEILSPARYEKTGAAPAAAVVPAGEYRLGTGDVLSIRVYDWRAGTSAVPGDEDLRLDRIRLDESGVVSMPFGEFKAKGQTVRELETAITESLRGRFLRQPRVWINIDEYRPFFVDGQVGRPGSYPYQPGLTVRKAVTIAGGLRERASIQKIFLVREQDPSSRRVRVDINTPVAPGDSIVVEESLF